MKSAVGPWVTGEDFFGRDAEMAVLRQHAQDGNHILLTGQRRMGKTSIARELGRRLREEDGWIPLFVDVEHATSSEDVVALLAEQVYRIPSTPGSALRRNALRLRAFVERTVGKLAAAEAFKARLEFRKALTAGSWARHGRELLRECARQDQPVLIVLDELPIFLLALMRDGGTPRVDDFLSWLRHALQTMDTAPVLVVSGSIGLKPLVDRLGLSDRVNYLHALRVPPWDRRTTIACIARLAETLAEKHGVVLDQGVGEAMYDRLGLGIPHHVQSFFVHMRDDARMRGVNRLATGDVERVYHEVLLGPDGQNDLKHYESRLRDHLGEDEHEIAMEILTEAATQGRFSAAARQALESRLNGTGPTLTASVLDVLEHDGYLSPTADGHVFASHLVEDWWRGKFGQGYVPLRRRVPQRQGNA